MKIKGNDERRERVPLETGRKKKKEAYDPSVVLKWISSSLCSFSRGFLNQNTTLFSTLGRTNNRSKSPR